MDVLEGDVSVVVVVILFCLLLEEVGAVVVVVAKTVGVGLLDLPVDGVVLVSNGFDSRLFDFDRRRDDLVLTSSHEDRVVVNGASGLDCDGEEASLL